MAKLMLVSVYGVGGDYFIQPWQRLVTVVDELQTLAYMRTMALRELSSSIRIANIPEENQIGILKALRVKLIDTGLTEMPESEADRIALWEKMTNRNKDVLVPA